MDTVAVRDIAVWALKLVLFVGVWSLVVYLGGQALGIALPYQTARRWMDFLGLVTLVVAGVVVMSRLVS